MARNIENELKKIGCTLFRRQIGGGELREKNGYIIYNEGLGAIRAQVKNFNISLQAKTPIFRMPRFNGLQIQVVHALG